jgi:hypothetical protein
MGKYDDGSPIKVLLLDYLAERYSSGTAKGFSVKNIGQFVLQWYAPVREGGAKLDVDDRSAVNECLEALARDGYLELNPLKSEKTFVLYGGTFTDKMEDLCADRGFVSVSMRSKVIHDMLVDVYDDLNNENLRAWVDECILISQDGVVPKNPNGFWMNTLSIDELRLMIETTDTVLMNETCMFFRNFCVNLFHDSKFLETSGLKGRIESLLLLCSDEEIRQEYKKLTSEFGHTAAEISLWASYGIERKPHYIQTQIDMVIATSKGEIWTRGLPYSFSSAYVTDEYSKIHLNVDTVVLIENLTTYEDFKCDDHTGKIYTGGFLGVADRYLLRRIYGDNRNVCFYHWSDIDAGGFRIFKNVQKYIPTVKPFRMSIEVLKEYAGLAKPLTDNDLVRLNACHYPEFDDLIAYMKENGIKLEQESFYSL